MALSPSTTAPSAAPSPETCQSRFEQGIALILHLWPALTFAVQNNWGGPDSADKRDWFAGQVAELFPPFASIPYTSHDNNDDDEPDAAYIEELLLQVMLDEFEVYVDDDSGLDTATEIVALRAQCATGQFGGVDRLLARWTARKGDIVAVEQGADQDGEETDWDDTTDDGETEDEDMENAAPPALVGGGAAQPRKERAEPEKDEQGFTMVTRKR